MNKILQLNVLNGFPKGQVKQNSIIVFQIIQQKRNKYFKEIENKKNTEMIV